MVTVFGPASYYPGPEEEQGDQGTGTVRNESHTRISAGLFALNLLNVSFNSQR